MDNEYQGPERRKNPRSEDYLTPVMSALESIRSEMDAREARFNHRLDVLVEKHHETHTDIADLKKGHAEIKTEITRWKDGAKLVNYIAITTAGIVLGFAKLWDSIKDHVK